MFQAEVKALTPARPAAAPAPSRLPGAEWAQNTKDIRGSPKATPGRGGTLPIAVILFRAEGL